MMPNSKIQPNLDVIGQFLAEITDGWKDLDGDPKIEVRFISKGKKPSVARFALDWMDEAVDHIQRMNSSGMNAYVCVNPVNDAHIKAGEGAKDTDIMAAFFCFADADDEGGMKNILSCAGPQFTMSVKTGTTPFVRGHAYWRLEEPVLNLQAWRDVQQSIAHNLKTDPVVINPSRIMRIAGTVSYPDEKKRGKGYVEELVTMRTEFNTDRDPVPFERMMRAFPPVKTAPLLDQPQTDGGIQIDLGKQAMDRAMAEQAILSGDNWHHNVVRLVASYVSKGLTDAEIHAITDRFTQGNYTVDDTRREVQKAIDGARDKGWTPQPDPIVEKMKAQVSQVAITAPEATYENIVDNWPTMLDDFNELTLPRRQWIYGHDYIRGFVSVLASAGGIGKTSLTIVEALAICTGRNLLDTQVKEKTKVWVLNLEDPRSEIQMRTLAAMKHYGISPEEVRGNLFIDGEDTIEVTLAAETRDGLVLNDAMGDTMIERIKRDNIGTVMIDPFVSTHLVNENSNSGIQAVVALLRRIARETNAAIVLVHHVRKSNGEDATIDSVRGAGALIGAARAARVVNRVSVDDAIQLGVSPDEATGLFRVDDGKSNLAPPADRAVYRRMIGVQLANEEWVGVCIPFKLPDAFDGITARDTRRVQDVIAGAEENQKPYRENSQASNWVGKAIAETLNLDIENPTVKIRVKSIIRTWISTDVLRIEKIEDNKKGREIPIVVVGQWVKYEDFQS